MSTVLVAIASVVLYLVAYNTYGRWLRRRIFNIDPEALTPSVKRNDGCDFVPSRRSIVFGHHFTSIAGTGPIVGPAIAVIWGWLPALLWVLIGSVLVGAVHDFGALVASLRNQGRTIGDYCGDIINPRVRVLFLLIILFALWIVIAIFGLVIAAVFAVWPASVFAVWVQIPIAVALGWWVNRRSGNLALASLVAVAVMYLTIWLGSAYPALQLAMAPTAERAAELSASGISAIHLGFISPIGFWTILLLVYCFIASTLPVQTLLQPRDYINSHQLIIAMGLLLLGVFVAAPPIVAPAFNLSPADPATPPWAPFLFITIACGACSGFHSLVSSGCSSKQLRSEGDAQFVGYGAMLLEGMLAVLVILACVAGIGMGYKGLSGEEAWNAGYAVWGDGPGVTLGAKLAPFIVGSANMIEALGLPHDFAVALMGVFVASFAATTLDTNTRLQRYVIGELSKSVSLPALANKYVASGIAVASGFVLAMWDVFRHADGVVAGFRVGGAGAMTLWPIFGATNQLLAGLALLVLTVWLYRRGKPLWITGIPMAFMLAMTAWALVTQLHAFAFPAKGKTPNVLLTVVGGLIMALEIWMIVEAAVFVIGIRVRKSRGTSMPELVESA